MEVLTKERLEQFLYCSGLHAADKPDDEFARCVDYLFKALKPYLKECERCGGNGSIQAGGLDGKMFRCPSCKPERRAGERRDPPDRRDVIKRGRRNWGDRRDVSQT